MKPNQNYQKKKQIITISPPLPPSFSLSLILTLLLTPTWKNLSTPTPYSMSSVFPSLGNSLKATHSPHGLPFLHCWPWFHTNALAEVTWDPTGDGIPVPQPVFLGLDLTDPCPHRLLPLALYPFGFHDTFCWNLFGIPGCSCRFLLPISSSPVPGIRISVVVFSLQPADLLGWWPHLSLRARLEFQMRIFDSLLWGSFQSAPLASTFISCPVLPWHGTTLQLCLVLPWLSAFLCICWF